MSNWYTQYQKGQERPPAIERSPELVLPSSRWDVATMGPAAQMQTRPRMNPGQCDTRVTDVFRTWTTDSGMPRHKHEVGKTMQSFSGAATQDLPSHMQKFREFLKQLEHQVKIALRGPDRTKDMNRAVYQQFVNLTMLPPKAFSALLEAQYGIELTDDDLERLFARYGDQDMNCFDLQEFIQRMVRNEAAVGSWGGDHKAEVDIYPGISPAFSSVIPDRQNNRGMPLQSSMSNEDSFKLARMNAPVMNPDGTMSSANNLGGSPLCPEFPKRPEDQRVKREIQTSILPAGETTFDSKLVRGYADSWVPPVGDGAWDVEPTAAGDGEKIGSHQGSRPIELGMGSTPDTLKNINKVEPLPYKLNSHSMISSQSATSHGIRAGDYARPGTGCSSRPGTGFSVRPGTGQRPGTADPTGLVTSKLKQKHMESQKKKEIPALIPSIRISVSRGGGTRRKSTRSCATNLDVLTHRMEEKSHRSKKSVHKFDPRRELFDMTSSTFRSTKRSYRSQR